MMQLRILSTVVTNHLCTECGTCSGICPTHALLMRETPGGQVLPQLVASRCTDCGLCDLVCPELELSQRLRESLSESMTGRIDSAYLAEACDPSVASASQTGGAGRALIAWCMEAGVIDGAVLVVDDPAEPLRPKAVITRNPSAVLGASRSKYCPVPVNALILEMLRFEGRLAYVGLSCHMHGLELAMQRLRKLRSKIVLRVGLFCDRVLTYPAAEFLARCAGLPDAEHIVAFDYRAREWQGWPGDVRISTASGQHKNVSRTARAGSRALFTPAHCWLCPDKLNVLCDLALGDPHGVAEGTTVPTAVIARTSRGAELLRSAALAGRIRLVPADPAVIVAGQHLDDNTRNAIAAGLEFSRRRLQLPAALRAEPLASARGPVPIWVRLAVWWSLESQKPWGARVLARLPTWEPRVWMWFKSGPRRRYRWARQVIARFFRTGRLRGSNSAAGPARVPSHPDSLVRTCDTRAASAGRTLSRTADSAPEGRPATHHRDSTTAT